MVDSAGGIFFRVIHLGPCVWAGGAGIHFSVGVRPPFRSGSRPPAPLSFAMISSPSTITVSFRIVFKNVDMKMSRPEASKGGYNGRQQQADPQHPPLAILGAGSLAFHIITVARSPAHVYVDITCLLSLVVDQSHWVDNSRGVGGSYVPVVVRWVWGHHSDVGRRLQPHWRPPLSLTGHS